MKQTPAHAALFLVVSILAVTSTPAPAAEESSTVAIQNPLHLPPDPIPCERIALGEPDDYKPCIARMPDGELLLTAFHQHKREGNKVMEQMLLFRSRDGGKSWSPPEKPDLLGREPYLTVLPDGTIFITVHLLAQDVRNPWGYTCGFLHRSTDRGKTWQSIRVESENIKPKANNTVSRNVLRLADGTLLLGADYHGGGGPYFVWRSTDNGTTWDKTRKCDPKGFQSKYAFFGGETWLWQAGSGKIWALVRVDSNEFPMHDKPIQSQDDQDDHFMLWSSGDGAKTFDRVRDFGDYGEMYMSILRLQDRRLLLTFTVRKRQPPLGVRAIPGVETEDGFEFDFAHDRVMLDTKTGSRYQGGGFGPTVQLDDGTLVTSCSYRGEDDKTHLEVVRWKLPAQRPAPSNRNGGDAAEAGSGIVLEVVGGKRASCDRVVEQTLDLGSASPVLGREAAVAAQAVRVVEIGASGQTLGTMISQVDAADEPGKFVVCWQVAGELGAGQTRRFRLALDGGGPVPLPAQGVTAVSSETSTRVTSGRVELTYSNRAAGMISDMSVDGATGSFTWTEKIYDGNQFMLSPVKSRLVAAGPLRVVYETEGIYPGAPSRPKAVYRFTHYAGQPVAYLTARVTQDYGHEWNSLHFVEIHFDPAAITHYVSDQPYTDSNNGRFDQTGSGQGAREWAAIYGPRLLLGVLDSTSPYIYNGGGRHYGAYLRSGVAPMSGLSQDWKCTLFFGGGPDALPALREWSRTVADAPVVKVRLPAAEEQIAQLAALVEKRRGELSQLSGEQWAAAYIRMHMASSKLRSAATAAGRGEFGSVFRAISEARAEIQGRDDVRAMAKGTVLSGTANGYPFLLNTRAAYFWSRPAEGAALISIHDRQSRQEFLQTDPATTSFWQATIKEGDAEKGCFSRSGECRVETLAGGLKLAWGGSPSVQVEASLAPADALLRLRLTAATRAERAGLLNITFPALSGILPLTAGAVGDGVLQTMGLGDIVPSPLLSGTPVEINYPPAMQFTALQDGSRGLYFADEDPAASRKDMRWSAETATGTIALAVNRPVLGWSGTEPVKDYTLPGDVVIGPFQGDWYDAAQLYRRWAVTAPWCAKGPIHARQDIAGWLSRAAYWTIGHLNDAEGIRHEIQKHAFLGSGGLVHAYGYYLSPQQDNLYPEVWPPRMGSAGFRKVVDEFHARGMRIVPYISGFLWDEDTESYRARQAADQGQIINQGGSRSTTVSYGGGTRLAQMCPGSRLWQDKLVEESVHGMARYGLDGWYYDFLTNQRYDCLNPGHGHPLGGGDYWPRSVRELYSRIRRELKAVNPEAILMAEYNAEYVIDLLDTQLAHGVETKAPLYQAVYHDYSLLFGGQINQTGPAIQGRWWLLGNQNGWHNVEGAYAEPPKDGSAEMWRRDGEYYRRLLVCYRSFAQPYLALGRMLRMPRVKGEPLAGTPAAPGDGRPAVEGSAWQAPDGTVGIFVLNYSDRAQPFTWTFDLTEHAGITAAEKVRLLSWSEGGGLTGIADLPAGVLSRNEKMEARGIMALKVEVMK